MLHSFGMAHAHPLPSDDLYLHAFNISSARSSPAGRLSADNPTTRGPRSAVRVRAASPKVAPNVRRLHLRNNKFKGAEITTAAPGRVSPFSACMRPPSPSILQTPQLYGVTLPGTPDFPSPRSESSPSARGKVLEKLHNSIAKRARRSAATVLVYDETALNEEGPTFKQPAEPKVPYFDPVTSSPMESLREMSRNKENTPPPSTLNFAMSDKIRKRSRAGQRRVSFQTTKYVETLESEIASLNTRLATAASPSNNRVYAAKLRALGAQVRSLQQDVADWESKFEERVSDEVFSRTRFEVGLKAHIRSLESELEVKTIKVIDLENMLEETERKVHDGEKQEHCLSRRLNMLTTMLASSPMKCDYQTAPSTPFAPPDAFRRGTKTRSLLLPRRNTAETPSPQRPSTHAWEDPNLPLSDTIREARFESHDYFSSPRADGESIMSTQPTSAGVTDCFSSVRSPSTSSRPISMISTSSFGASWGLPSQFTELPKSPSRPRKMRKFPSGTVSLKPLILPSQPGNTSAPISAPAPETPCSPSRNDSGASFDPTTAFMSSQRTVKSIPISTPYPTTLEVASSQALEAFEDKPEWTGYETKPNSQSLDMFPDLESDITTLPAENHDQEQQSLSMCLETQLHSARIVSTGTIWSNERQSQPMDFMDESDSTVHSQLLSEEIDALLTLGPDDLFFADLLASPMESSTSMMETPIALTLGASDLDAEIADHARLFQSSCDALFTHHAARDVSLVTSSLQSPPQPTSTPTEQAKPEPSFLTRMLTSILPACVFSSLSSDPHSIARRLLFTSWTVHSSHSYLGGMGWWLFGLLSGRRPRSCQRKEGKFSEGHAHQTLLAYDGNPRRARATSCGTEEMNIGIVEGMRSNTVPTRA